MAKWVGGGRERERVERICRLVEKRKDSSRPQESIIVAPFNLLSESRISALGGMCKISFLLSLAAI